MPAIQLPTEGQPWTGVFPGKTSGNIWQTHNIDLEKVRGRSILADKSRIEVDSTDDLAGLGTPTKFVLTNADTDGGVTYRWWTTASGMFKSGDTTASTWASDTGTANSPAIPQDMLVHGSANGEERLAVTTATNISILNDSTAQAWTASWWVAALGQAALDSSIFHSVGSFDGLMAIIDQDSNTQTTIHTVDSLNRAVSDRLTFPVEFEGKFIFDSPDGLWIALRNKTGGNGVLYFWNTNSEAAEGPYQIEGAAPMCGFVIEGVSYVVTNKGNIQKFTSTGFQTIQRFPMWEERLTFRDNSLLAANAADATISPHGVTVEGNLAYILVGAPLTSRRMRSGIWVFNAETLDLYHFMGVGIHTAAGTDLNYGGHLNRIGGLVRLQNYVLGIGGFLIGSNVLTTATAGKNAIHRTVFNTLTGSNQGRSRGYFITPYIRTKDITAFWTGLWVRFRRFINGENLIRTYYRTREPLRDADGADDSVLQVTGTWASTTTFTAVVPTGVRVGHIVEVMAGDNAGCLFPISILSGTPNGSSSLTVTIDDTTPTSSSATFTARFDNWKVGGTITDTATNHAWTPFPGSDSDGTNFNVEDEVQIMVELRGFSMEVKDILPTNAEGRSVEP